ncbi:VanZ family protein [Salipaludibacillus daqingensis]|uniref:VanZ family protein n=1 Tax=Salipaludibacillus daqingensis TaxID=3041001 RepID=UPI002473E16E|nr:VanZ family protein [Salipaludibacillus daqingensis]
MRPLVASSMIIIVTFSLIVISVASQITTITIDSSLHEVYKNESSLIFLMDINSSFYSLYSFQGNPALLTRKIGHFVLYGILASFIFVILSIKRWSLRRIIAIGTSSFIGLLDEIHQHFLINRSGRLLDVYINTVGSISFVLLTLLLYYLISKRESTKKHRNKSFDSTG